MHTETFTARHIETREKAVQIEHNGITAWVPRSQIELMKIDGERIELRIPNWLYCKKFEPEREAT